MTPTQPSAAATPRLRLYVAASTPNSARAQRNLEAALAALSPPSGVKLEIIDVFSDARRAMRDGVLVTPTLVGIFPQGRVTIIGDLTDPQPLRDLLARIPPGGRGA